MESRNGRSWIERIGVAALFTVLVALGSCDGEGLTGVRPQRSQMPDRGKMSMSADSTGGSTEDNCYLIDGQWICP